MALTFYIVSTILFAIAVVHSNIVNRYWLTLPNILFVSLSVNFLFYLCGWSTQFIEPVYNRTYYIIGLIQIVFAIISFGYKKPPELKKIELKRIKIGRGYGISIAILLLVLCILFCAIENLYLHGGLFAGNDLYHTGSMPLLGPILKALYPVAYVFAFIEFVNSRSKTTLVLFIISLVYSVVGSRGRFWAVCSLLCVLIFAAYYERPNREKRRSKKGWFASLKLRYRILIIAVFVVAFNYLMTMGVNRISMFTYADIIGYSGPWRKTAFGEAFAWYYGYFPFSFYNLNTTARYIYDSNIITWGGFLFYPFLSIINLEGIFGIDYSEMTINARVIQNNAATVATGYYESISDFHDFFLISVVILVIITFATMRRKKLNNYISFSYMLVVWFFMSFLNVFTVGIPVYVFIISYILSKLFVKEHKLE